MDKKFTVAALYCFARFDGFSDFRQPLLDMCVKNEIKGTLLLAHEGINGTVAGTKSAIEKLIAFITAHKDLKNPELKYSWAHEMPFTRMKVRLKKEIVTMGVEDVDPLEIVGTYVAPQDWNALIEDEDTIVIDTRNDYEYALGTFEGAVDPDTKTFREFPQWIAENEGALKTKKKIAMFCTGGIRCEKSTAYVRGLGYDQVYHLKGGILKYLEDVPKEESLWKGECFVFDDRVSVGHGLEVGNLELCRACRHPISEQDKLSDNYEAGVSCDACIGERSDIDRTRFRERNKQIKLARKRRNTKHIGD